MKRIGMLIFSIAFIALMITSCEEKSVVALGQDWEIYVIAEEDVWSETEQYIRPALEKKLVTPMVEKEFVVEHVLPQNLNEYLQMRNLLFISVLESDSRIDDILKRSVNEDVYQNIVAGEEYLFVTQDQWAVDQFVMILAAPDIESLVSNVGIYPDYLYTYFDDFRDARLKENLFFHTQGSLENELKEKYGWTMKLPSGYHIEQEDTSENFVQINKIEPDMNIFVHWMDNQKSLNISESWALEKTNRMIAHYRNAYLQEGYYFTTENRFHNQSSTYIMGLWQSDTEYIGGPMFTYAFRDSNIDRVYVVTGHIYAPDRRKEPYLRELELIVDTFKSFGAE